MKTGHIIIYIIGIIIMIAMPVLADTARISPSTPIVTDDLVGYCNSSTLGGTFASFSWIWYKDDVINASGNNSFYTNITSNPQVTAHNNLWEGGGGAGGPPDYLHDDDYGTYSYVELYAVPGTRDAYAWGNYTKPENASINLSIYKFKTDKNTSVEWRYGDSLPAGCFDQSPIQIRYHSQCTSGGGCVVSPCTWTTWIDCWDGDSWENIQTNQQVTAGGYPAVVGIAGDEFEFVIFNGTENGVEMEVSNISSVDTTIGEEWILSCRAFNMTDYGAWTNSSLVTILSGNTPPTISGFSFNQSGYYGFEDMTINISAYDDDLDNISVNITFQVNAIDVLSTVYSPVQNGTVVNSSIGYGNYSGYDNVTAAIFASDGTDLSITYEGNITINATPQCIDGIDNDADGVIDLSDQDCSLIYDDAEYGDIEDHGAYTTGFECSSNGVSADTILIPAVLITVILGLFTAMGYKMKKGR